MTMDYEKWGWRKNPELARITEGLSRDEFNGVLADAFVLLKNKPPEVQLNLGQVVARLIGKDEGGEENAST